MKIEDLPLAAALDDSETLPIVQNNASKRAQLSAIMARAEIAARGEIGDYLGGFRPFRDVDALDDALRRIQSIDLFTTVDGIDIAWPDEMLVREFARLAGGELRLRLSSHDAGAYTPIVQESNVGSPYVVTAGQTGAAEIALLAIDASLGVPINTIVGVAQLAEIDGAFGAYTGTYSFATAGLYNHKLLASTALVQRVEQLIEKALVDEDRRDAGPWLSSVRDARLRDDIVQARGWFAQTDHRYGIGAIELSDFSGSLGYWRATITVRDFTTGIDVARAAQIFTADPTGSEQTVIAHKSTLGAYTGKLWLLTIGADAQWTDGGNSRTFALYSQAGFRRDTIDTWEDVETFVHGPPSAQEEVRIAAAGGDHAGIVAAHAPFYNSVYDEAAEGSKYSAFPNSDFANWPHRLLFDVADEGHDEKVSSLVALPFSIRRGRGMFATRFWNDTPGKRVFENTWSVFNMDFAAEQFADEYLDHIDNVNANSKPAVAGDAIQNSAIFQAWLRVWYRAHGDGSTSSNNSPCIGQGISSGQVQRFMACLFEQVGGGPVGAIHMHNSPGSTRGSYVSFEQGTILRARADIAALQLIGTYGQATRTEIYASPDSFIQGGIKGSVSMPDNDPDMPARARDRWPYTVRGTIADGIAVTDSKMRVLSIDAGTSLSTASGVATALFGTGYDAASGKGEALTLDGSTQALASKLAGLQGATMSVARNGFGAETITIGDYSGQTEAQVLFALNAQLTNYNIAALRIDGDIGIGT